MATTRFKAQVTDGKGELYLYSEIGGWEGTRPKEVVDEIARLQAEGAKSLTVYLNSPGGDVFDGHAIYNAIKRFPGQKTVHVDGLAASMASVIAMAGDKIITAANGMWMIHQPWGIAIGNADEMVSRAALLEQLGQTILDVYARRTGQTSDDLDAWMRAETWMSADEAKARGFTDEISDPTDDEDGDECEAKTLFPILSKFKNTPTNAAQLLRASVRERPAATSRQPPASPASTPEAEMSAEQIKAMMDAMAALTSKVEAMAAKPAEPKPEPAPVVEAPRAEVLNRLVGGAPVIAKFNTSRANKGREARSDERAKSAAERRALPFARHAISVAVAHDLHITPGQAAEHLGFEGVAESIAKGAAMSEGDADAGGTFVRTEIQDGFIDFLDEAPGSIMSLIPAGNRIRSSQPTIQYPTLTSGATGAWVGENPSTGSQEAFATGTKLLTAKKQRIEVLLSRDLLRGASNIEQIVLEKLRTRSMQLDEIAFVEGTGSAFQPRGLETIVEAANTAAMTASPDYENSHTDLLYLLKRLALSKVPTAAGRAFIIPEQAKWGLLGYQNAAGTAFPYENEILQGRLVGQPFASSSLIGTDKVYCFAPGEAIWFEQLAMLIEADNSYIKADGTAGSASGADQVCIRLWRKVDCDLMHDLSVSVKSGITWGA